MNLRADEVRVDLERSGPLRASGTAAERVFTGVCTDSRQDVAGKLFFALVGEHFDAHEFVGDVVRRGAAGVVVRDAAFDTLRDENLACYGVADTLRALQTVARASLARARPTVVAITGSNGKTTTKDLTVAALGVRGRVHGTRGNLNNHIGVPLTILSRRGDEAFLVAEAGTSGFGELELLSRILAPDVVVITNIGRAHLETLGSQDGVARAKAELLVGLRSPGIAVLNADDAYFDRLVARAGAARIVSFGFAPHADYRVESQRALEGGRQELVVHGARFVLERPGRGNAANAAAALAVATELGADLGTAAAAIGQCEYTGQRSAWSHWGGVDVLDDTYNANPDSMALAIELLAARRGRRIAVLGDMLELGPDSARLHAEVGAQVAAAGIEHLFGLGAGMAHAVERARRAGVAARHFTDHAPLIEALQSLVTAGDAVLVKGSRGSRMEHIVAAFKAGVA
jgi:UDP-N-acetylmuramoyl-tripeptide--D-alanyl-D-alanine ligase